MTAPIVLRPAVAADGAYIVNSWLWSWWDDQKRYAAHGTMFNRDRFEAGQQRTIARLLRRSLGIVACVPEVPDEICGYAVCEPDHVPGTPPGSLLHYLLVKKPYRNNGVASALLAAIGKVDAVSHMTRAWAQAFGKRGICYDPHAREA